MLNKSILITGGCGFIGSNLCDMFIRMGYTIICVDSLDEFYSSEIKFNNIRHLFKSNKFHFEHTDMTNKALLEFIFKAYAVDAVIHLASKVNVQYSIEKEAEYIYTNVTCTSILLDVMRNRN